MALQLSFETSAGITGDYWRIVDISVNIARQEASITIALYKDSTARFAGKDPIFSNRQYLWKGADYPYAVATMDIVNNNIINIAYNKMKVFSEWDGSTDV